MASYNIYGYISTDVDNPPLHTTVVLSDDDSEIVSINCVNPERQEEAEEVLGGYMDAGFLALDAVARYAGSYGTVKEANPDGSLVAAVEDVEDTPTAAVDASPSAVPDGIMAMTGDDGIVETLFRTDDEFGAIIRHGGEWVPMTDPTIIESLAFVGVTDDAIDVYDRHEAAGKLAPIKQYPPSPEGPYWPDPVIYEEGELEDVEADDVEEVEPQEDEEPIAASVTLDTADDLVAAIAAAVENPELQWYVERRVAALGLAASLPWLAG